MCINKEIKITKNIYNEFKIIKFLSELFHYFTGKITYIVFLVNMEKLYMQICNQSLNLD